MIVNIIDPSFVMKNNLRENSIRTTLSKNIQQTALGALHEQIKNLKDQNLSDGAILVINNSTNEVLAYVANAGDQFSSSPRVDNIRSRRQAGSTLKPFIYAHAIDMNFLTSDSIISDSAIDIPIGLGSIYFPRNYDNSFHGDVPLKVALGSSLNVPAVKTLLLVTGEKIINLFKKLGLKRLEDASYYGPSLALGSVDITLWDLVHAYMGLHNGKNFKKTTEDELFNILSDDENRRLTFGTNSVLAMPFKVAVKTGTSKDMRDNWCIGYSKNYTVGVWVGNSNGKAMWNVSGITGAAPIFRAVMLELEKNNSFNQYLVKPEMDKINKLEDKSISKIRYPVDGEIIGFDNDIPLNLQKMPIEIENLKSNQKILINDKPIQEKLENYLWPVTKGHFELSLQDYKNESIHKIHFEVR
jgi:penicillin-binding protein 1C